MSRWTPEIKAAGKRFRARIYQLISDNPGIASSTIAELLDMPIMIVAGHLTVLSKEGKVRVKRGALPTRRKPRGPMRIYPVAQPAPRTLHRGGAGNTPAMPDDPEHRAWMDYWQARRAMRQTSVLAMRGRV